MGARLGTSMAQGLSDSRSGGSSHSDRRWREAFLSTLCLGGDAEPRTFADSPSGPSPYADEMVGRFDGQKRKPDSGPDRAAVLARRVLRSLPTPFESSTPHHRVYRGKPGCSRIGVLGGALAMVQRGMAGETACPTKPAKSPAQNVETQGTGFSGSSQPKAGLLPRSPTPSVVRTNTSADSPLPCR